MNGLFRITRTWLPAIPLAAAVLAAGDVAAVSRGASYALEGSVIAGGGVARARGGCFELSGTIAQPVAGTSAGAGFEVTSGFWAQPIARPDQLFRSGFEGCSA